MIRDNFCSLFYHWSEQARKKRDESHESIIMPEELEGDKKD